ncbi:hypothetical protein GIB67_005769 [Kingdonia uniflora]|uniref:Uncharacterized protein n=1 Tax=Kingdonia uniflora TaxID=39325 RepID=A0A7J7KVL8_9MAGN|nr:hypothetical protein GIB67_005769 [Kingdonia uniflora]
MSEMNATFQHGVVLDVMTLYLGNKFLVRNDTDLLKMWKMSDVESLWDVHFYIEQRNEVLLGIVDPIDLDAIPEVLLIDSDDDAPIEEIATQENIDRCNLKFRDLAKEYDNIFAEEEDAIHSVPPQPTYGELRVGMEWAIVRQKTKDWEEKGLVLVPRAQTYIDKLKRQYGQYRIEGTKKGDGNTGQGITGQYVIIAVTGLSCVHVVSVIVPYRYSWANFVSEYHKLSSYVKTYKDAIYPVVNPSEWGQPQPPYFLPPPLVRGPGRSRKEMIHGPDEKRLHKRCSTCGCFGHNKTTCKGPPVVPTPRVVRTRQRLDTNTSRANFMINISLRVDTGGERDVGRTGSGGRTGRNIVEGMTGARGGRDRGKPRGGGRTRRNTVGGRTGGENVGGRTGTRGGGARGRTKQTFQAPRQSEGATQVSTSQAPSHSQGDTQVSQSQVRAPRQSQNQQSQVQALSSNPYKKEILQPRRKWI